MKYAEKLKEKYEPDSVADTTILADGTWERLGFASLNGGAVTIGGNETGKCRLPCKKQTLQIL